MVAKWRSWMVFRLRDSASPLWTTSNKEEVNSGRSPHLTCIACTWNFVAKNAHQLSSMYMALWTTANKEGVNSGRSKTLLQILLH